MNEESSDGFDATDDPTDAKYFAWQADSVPWRKPYRDAYADAAKALLDRCSPTERGPDAADATFALEFLTRYLDPLFQAVMYHPRSDVAEDSVRYLDDVYVTNEEIDRRFRRGEYYFRWHHRDLTEEMTDREVLYIDKRDLLQAVGDYLRHPQMHTDFLDWYCAETLCYREWLGTVNTFRRTSDA